ncbi:hypothetical protein H7097_02000 [Aeromicrobium sp.]|nr:hypothetical protein [Candidatus Saccharibacteria bacterium]
MSDAIRFKDRVHIIGVSANDKRVYANLMNKALASNISGNPHLLRLAEDAVTSSQLKGPVVQIEYDMGRAIGRSDIVETTDADAIFYARQTKAAGFTRFVKNRTASSTEFVTVSMARDDDDEYEITNIWIGKSFPVTPDHADATPLSTEFWATHAVLYNGQPIVSSTLTKTSPY